MIQNATLQDQISKQQVLKLAQLANLDLSDQEAEKYQTEVASILEMISDLQEIDTKGTNPTYQVSGNSTKTRPDVVTSTNLVIPEDLLSLSDQNMDQQIKVKKIL